MKQSIFIFFVTLLLYTSGFGQDRTINGKIIGAELGNKKENINPEFWELPNAKIFDQDTTLLGTADEKGIFAIQISQNVNEIVVGSVGMELENITITGNCEFLEIILIPYVIYDFVSAKKTAKLKKKNRRILPELYSAAHEEGIFKREEPCR